MESYRTLLVNKYALLLIVLSIIYTTVLPAAGTSVSEHSQFTQIKKTNMTKPFATLPIAFEKNQGQTDKAVFFSARTPEYQLLLSQTGAIWQTRAQQEKSAIKRQQSLVRARLQMHLLASNANASISGVDRLPGMSNYLIGKPAQWITSVPHFAKVSYHNVYSGIDMVYYSVAGQLEYDFIVKPKATPKTIHLSFTGADNIEIDDNGGLLVKHHGQRLQWSKPIVYQIIKHKRVVTAGAYTLDKERHVGFHIGPYDKAHTLYIDPMVLGFSSYLGGSSSDVGYSIATGNDGSIYVTGVTESSDFPQTRMRKANGPDAFVTKLSSDGNQILYATYLGGNDYDAGTDIAVDADGNAYITGATGSTDFPTRNAIQATHGSGFIDAFVAKLAPDGQLLYSTFLGGDSNDFGYGIAVNNSGIVTVTGEAESSNFPLTNARQSVRKGISDAFVAQFAEDGQSLRYCTYLGGDGYDSGRSVALDKNDTPYIVGETRSTTSFPVSHDAIQSNLDGIADAFVVHLSDDGQNILYASYFGGNGYDAATDITIGNDDSIYITGETESVIDFPITFSALQNTLHGVADAFVTKLAPGGQTIVYSTYLGGSRYDAGTSIAVDSNGSAFVTGQTESPADFPTSPDAFISALRGSSDAFFTKLNPDGQSLAYSTYLGGGGYDVYSTYIGGSGYDIGIGIALDKNGNAYITGRTESFNFPTSDDALLPQYVGSEDAFVTQFIAN